MALLSRTVIWRTAWGLLPLAMLLNVWLGHGPESEVRLQQQAHSNAMARRWREAATLYEQAARAAPGSAVAAYNTGASYQMLGDLERAREWNEQALRLDPEMELALQQRKRLAKRGEDAAGSGGARRP